MSELVEPVPTPPPEAPPPAPLPEPEVILRTQGLTRAFHEVKAVNGVDLELRRGEVYGFLGRNGAGKTTTLRMLMGILRPDTGDIELMGQRVRRVRAAQKQHLGYVSQEQVFYPWMTALELGKFVSGFYPHWDDARFQHLLHVLDVPKERKAAQLSGGTRMKLGLALALSHRPPLLILDEPTAGLDPVARREFLDILRDQVRREGQTALFSSHLVGEVEEVAHRIGILHEGRLRFQGSLDTLRQSVRRVAAESAPEPLPPGLSLVRRERLPDGRLALVLFGTPGDWATSSFAPETVETLSLENIFLAYARRSDES
ncbi:ABC-2 type transport system ATP-binding protein [Archangium gephyra]|uniref:ABC transporter, ATP-binding protein n=1 Tax=Archangium gephyra TaxID=48 RepID=A0AAC8TEX3_9BACT|nr:ABC transporter ATP-binding protein [Archangium gephyra]AKJ01996.1 ABC transporter, ATP-binding protein [Archangium gephyra]REG34801.1 ABC-2 type transport system ATP-binding protein [Archangium gephyra]